MPLLPGQHMSVTTADSHYRRADRDLRYLTTAFNTYTALRAKLRADLERQLDRIASQGPKGERMRAQLESALARLDQEDAEEPDEEMIAQYPRSSASQRPAYRILSFQKAIAKAEERLQRAQIAKEQAIAESEVSRTVSDAASEAPSSRRPGISPLGKNLDSRLASLMRGKTLERTIQSRAEQGSPTDEGNSWLGKWSFRGVGASKYEYRPAAAAA